MKNCIEAIKNWVGKVSSMIADVEVVYGINHPLDYHIVVIRPSSIYNDNEYMKLEESFSDEFYSLFPNENIIITDDDSIIDITEVVITKSIQSMEQMPAAMKYKFQGSICHNRVSQEDIYALAA